MKVIINGREIEWNAPKISHYQVVIFAFFYAGKDMAFVENETLRMYLTLVKNRINDLGRDIEGYQPTDKLDTSNPPKGNTNER